MPYLVERRPYSLEFGLNFVLALRFFGVFGLGNLFAFLFGLFVCGDELLEAGGEFVYLASELIYFLARCNRRSGSFFGVFGLGNLFAFLFGLFVCGDELLEAGGEFVYLAVNFANLSAYVCNGCGSLFGGFFIVLLVGGEQLVDAGGEFVYLARYLVDVCGNCGGSFFGSLFNRGLCRFGCLFVYLVGNFVCRLLFGERGAHLFKLSLHCGELVVHALEHGVGGRRNFPRDAFGYLFETFFVYDDIVVVRNLVGIRGGNDLFGRSFDGFGLSSEFFGNAVYDCVVVNLGRGYRRENCRGNLVGNFVAVDFGHAVGERRRCLVGNRLFVDAVCGELFGYELGNLVCAGRFGFLGGSVGYGNFARDALCGELFDYAVVVEIFNHGLGKRTAAFVVHYDVEIVGRERAYLARNLVGERVGVGILRLLCGLFGRGLHNLFGRSCGRELFGYAVCYLVVVDFGGGVNLYGLSLSVFAHDNLGYDDLLGNLRRYVVGRDDLLGRHAVGNLLCKPVIVEPA